MHTRDNCTPGGRLNTFKDVFVKIRYRRGEKGNKNPGMCGLFERTGDKTDRLLLCMFIMHEYFAKRGKRTIV